MKKNILLKLVISLILFPVILSAQTEISGGINANTTWTLQNSPYIITGNTVIFGNNTLTIEPGVTIKFNDDVQLRIQGSLIAIGNENENITFTSNNSNPQRGSWLEINLEEFEATCILEYVQIEYADSGLKYNYLNTTSYIKNSVFKFNNYAIQPGRNRPQFPITIDSVIFTNNDIGIAHYHDEVNLINCEFTNNRIGAQLVESNVNSCIFNENTEIGLDGNTTTTHNSTFTNNGVGISQNFFNDGAFKSELIENTIKYNDIGIKILGYTSGATISDNTICDNTSHNVINTRSGGADFSNNCWCTEDLNEIESTIEHGLDDINLGVVSIEPIKTNCIDSTLGLDEIFELEEANKFYPNPVESEIFFNNSDEKEYEIFSLNGSLIKKGITTERINVSNLSKGVYFIRFYSRNQSKFITNKLIKK